MDHPPRVLGWAGLGWGRKWAEWRREAVPLAPVIKSSIWWWCRLAGIWGKTWQFSVVSLWMMCSVLLWTVGVWLDWDLLREEGCLGPVETAGSSRPVRLPELPRMAPSESLLGP